MSDEKAPEEIPDVELPPVEPFSEPPVEPPIEVTPPPVEPFSEPLVEAPVGTAPPPPPEAPVAIEPAPSSGAGDTKLWALLAYVLSPVVPIVILLVENMKNQSGLKPHTMQALVAGIAIIAVTFVLGVIPIIGCLAPNRRAGGLDSDDLLGVPGVQRQRGHDPGRDEPRQDPGLGLGIPDSAR